MGAVFGQGEKRNRQLFYFAPTGLQTLGQEYQPCWYTNANKNKRSLPPSAHQKDPLYDTESDAKWQGNPHNLSGEIKKSLHSQPARLVNQLSYEIMQKKNLNPETVNFYNKTKVGVGHA